MAKASNLEEVIWKCNGTAVQLNVFLLGTETNSPKYMHCELIF